MKKIVVLLVLCMGLIGCKSKIDKVIDGLDSRLHVSVQQNKLNLVLFCTDIKDLNAKEYYKNEDLEKCASTVLKNEVEAKVEFRRKYDTYIKKHSVEDSINYLYIPYKNLEVETFIKNFQEIEKLIDVSSWTHSKDDIWTLKKTNLLILWRNSIKDPLTYSIDSQEIKNNNSVKWQKEKIEESFPGFFD
ncbi:hypothetical protein [Sebaldella sp. S0638]|uniref:hypothetical protein n=1 Tax=Sebaldella sp. S0638 TaxID=2957809 RepID=UPI0020A1FDB5|nr:hypothetical protein [Sebaldella sp. S0638]MCP1226602.1 hypothetical protein [Sebaldella sp. S0638]